MTATGASDAPLHVVAGALVDGSGRVLIAERPAGKAFAGRWEFPGGKKLPHETPRDALNRELLEELGIQVARARPLISVTHRYAPGERAVLIDCWRVDQWRGEIASLDGQRLRWCEREELPRADILEADRPIVTALRLPGGFFRVDDPDALAARIPGPRGRERAAWIVSAPPRDAKVVARLRAFGDHVYLLDPAGPPDGVDGRVLSSPPAARSAADDGLVGVLVGSAQEARAAAAAGADFLLVPDRAVAEAEDPALAGVGLPYYVNVAQAATGGASAATGTLWWKPPAR